MNSTITFPAPEPTLKLSRPSAEKWAAALAEERRRLLDDQEALREREENLRQYESRLRALQEEIASARGRSAVELAGLKSLRPPSRAPFGDAAALAAGWDKLHRARELLEAEQAHLREERHVQREREAALDQREAAVAAREAFLAERERGAATAADSGEPVAGEHSISTVARITRVPFDMARSVFGGKRS